MEQVWPCKLTTELQKISKEDIGGMKILSIVQRATKREYIDIYFLLKEFGLENLLNFAKKICIQSG